jgi:hypothetical protein
LETLAGRSSPAVHQIANRIELGAHVVINTIYDQSDGDNDVGRRELGLSRLATIELRRRLNAANRGIAALARERRFLLAISSDSSTGHGLASKEPWFVNVIEPNLAGATATAEHGTNFRRHRDPRGDANTTAAA